MLFLALWGAGGGGYIGPRSGNGGRGGGGLARTRFGFGSLNTKKVCCHKGPTFTGGKIPDGGLIRRGCV